MNLIVHNSPKMFKLKSVVRFHNYEMRRTIIVVLKLFGGRYAQKLVLIYFFYDACFLIVKKK